VAVGLGGDHGLHAGLAEPAERGFADEPPSGYDVRAVRLAVRGFHEHEIGDSNRTADQRLRESLGNPGDCRVDLTLVEPSQSCGRVTGAEIQADLWMRLPQRGE
jgi:hypothetical protein